MATARMGTALRQIQHLFVEGRLASLPDGELLERFLSGGDEAAFTALVERHGPMVLGTCRAVLRDANAAEDAFQATFLVLVCKARSLRGRGALASWLYQVAHRIAIQAGAEAARRRKRERLAGQLNATDGHRVAPDDEWREILHEELARLSDKYRLPLLLCDLEGKTHAQAASELNCGEATVRRRLTARPRTPSIPADPSRCGPHGRHARNDSRPLGPGDSPPRLGRGDRQGRRTDELDRRAARGRRDRLDDSRGPRAQIIARHVIESIAGGCRFGRFPDRARRNGLGCRDIRAGQGRGSSDSPDAKSPIHAEALPAPAKTEKPADPQETVTYRGRVLDADGRPFPGASLYLNTHEFQNPYHSPVRATSGPDGRFRFAVPKSDFDTLYWDAPWKGHACARPGAGRRIRLRAGELSRRCRRVDLAARQ